MTKTLYLLRHAKSDWGDPALDDHDRPLNLRGRKAAARMGAHLASLPVQPALVLSSTSVRTRETWALLSEALESVPEVRFDEALYLASACDILAAINALDADPAALMVIGHNPGMEELAHALATSGDRGAIERLYQKYPTAALATFTFEGRWRDLDRGLAELQAYVRPRDLD